MYLKQFNLNKTLSNEATISFKVFFACHLLERGITM